MKFVSGVTEYKTNWVNLYDAAEIVLSEYTGFVTKSIIVTLVCGCSVLCMIGVRPS